MNVVDLLKILSVPNLKVTFEYNFDYNCHTITASMNDIEGKMLVDMRDCMMPNMSSEIIKELRGTIDGVRKRYKEVYINDERI